MKENCEQPFDPSATISAVTDSEEVSDYGELREFFHIYPGEDGSLYRNLKLLGMGGMGVVYSAEDPTLERRVALKILREPYRAKREQIGKFVNEARITAKIDHPNIVAVHQLGVNQHHGVYFSMRRISGETLLTAIRKLREGDEEARRIYTRRRLLDIFIAGCNGVAAAHEKKILHCDLKPSNIMIGAFGEVLVLDWGLAREFGTPLSSSSTISGTPAFMAPELVTGELSVPDEKTEVYALGTILYSILTWQPSPFDMSLDKSVLMEMVASGRSLPLKAPRGHKLNRELAAICRKAMAHAREDRYSTVAELLGDLHNYRDGYAVEAYSPNIFYRFFKLLRRRPVVPIALVAAMLTVLVHETTVYVSDFIHDRSLLRSSLINMRIAERYYLRTVNSPKDYINTAENENLLQTALNRKDREMRAQLALMEYFSIVDASAGFSIDGKEEFASRYGAEIFRRILGLQISNGEAGNLKDILDRCRRSDLFPKALQSDPILADLVKGIEQGTGKVFFNFLGNEVEPLVKVTLSGGTKVEMPLAANGGLTLPAGECLITFSNGLRVHLWIVPGSRESFNISSAVDDSSIVFIPADHFYTELPVSGSIKCNVPAFVVKRKCEPGIYNFNGAAAVLKKNPGWRLPHPVEALKAWNKNSENKYIYDVDNCSEPLLLKNGDFFDPVLQKIVKKDKVKYGRIHLVREVNADF